jgi:stage II sporulation protein D
MSMINREPKIKVALLQSYKEAQINLNGRFRLPDGRKITGHLRIRAEKEQIILIESSGVQIAGQKEIFLSAHDGATFTVFDVQIGIDFHWQRSQEQSFRGDLFLFANSASSFDLINEISLEDYIESVISSEMSAHAPLEFLKAQATVARSWLVAMLERKQKHDSNSNFEKTSDTEIISWHDINDHQYFDVCADDHCQRYQGITKITSENVGEAVRTTQGLFLVYKNKICDARYHKACGGQTEIFSTAWEDKSLPYLQSVTDYVDTHAPIVSEKDAETWLRNKPPAYCNTSDKEILHQILSSFDQETLDFYRWQVIYKRQDLEEIIRKKSGIDIGELKNLIPIERGPSGRICKLKIEGSKRAILVGKELEIRRWLSKSHLLSSAFVVSTVLEQNGKVSRFILHGGGWGHGVGLCQIGAAVMAAKGFPASEILSHYFTGAILKKLY